MYSLHTHEPLDPLSPVLWGGGGPEPPVESVLSPAKTCILERLVSSKDFDNVFNKLDFTVPIWLKSCKKGFGDPGFLLLRN